MKVDIWENFFSSSSIIEQCVFQMVGGSDDINIVLACNISDFIKYKTDYLKFPTHVILCSFPLNTGVNNMKN